MWHPGDPLGVSWSSSNQFHGKWTSVAAALCTGHGDQRLGLLKDNSSWVTPAGKPPNPGEVLADSERD